MKDNIQCLNCEREDWKFTKNYCTKCYPIALKINKLGGGLDIYNFFIGRDYSEKDKKSMLNECAFQLKSRLKDIRDSNVLRENITAHELEAQINSAIKSFGKKGFCGRYGLGKINDYLEFGLKEKGQKEFVYKLFAKIKILNKFQINYYRVYDIKK